MSQRLRVVAAAAHAGGAVVDDAPVEEDVDEGDAVVDSPPEQPAAFQIDSALQ